MGGRDWERRGAFPGGMTWTPNQDICETSRNYAGVQKLLIIDSETEANCWQVGKKNSEDICLLVHLSTHPPINYLFTFLHSARDTEHLDIHTITHIIHLLLGTAWGLGWGGMYPDLRGGSRASEKLKSMFRVTQLLRA